MPRCFVFPDREDVQNRACWTRPIMWIGFIVFYIVTILLGLLPFVPQWTFVIWVTGMLMWTFMVGKFEGLYEIVVTNQQTEEKRDLTSLATEPFHEIGSDEPAEPPKES